MTDKNKKESDRLLKRIEAESETFGGTSMGRTVDQMSKPSRAEEDDAIERLGKKIGRSLSLVAFVGLSAYLVFTYVL